ncbi:MAG TPA: carboxymuconolactone decarboxylase family protein [Kiritimatiellia bacterium]|nr:carboxymuconolactone decarboxylase family protein [Kiritimatiellia bacterium]HPS08481.1 carboxymuconolactone decarboxylase family protein [Kiritimatiellia bacterium]
MDDALKELIAIGASVTAHCQPCVTYHVEKARSLGVGEAEIQETVGVGQMVERGAGAAMRDFTQNLLEKPGSGDHPENGRVETPPGDARCHCG